MHTHCTDPTACCSGRLLLGLRGRRPEARPPSASPGEHRAPPQPGSGLQRGESLGTLSRNARQWGHCTGSTAPVGPGAVPTRCRSAQSKGNRNDWFRVSKSKRPLGPKCATGREVPGRGWSPASGASGRKKRGSQSEGHTPLQGPVAHESSPCPEIRAAIPPSLSITSMLLTRITHDSDH